MSTLRIINTIITLTTSVLISTTSFAQNYHKPTHPAHAIEFKSVRIAGLIGHTLIKDDVSGENFFIPSWGFDLEYWPKHNYGFGLHSDLEIETFILVNENHNNNEVERINPFVISFDLLYKPWKDLVLQFGPGIELEQEENYYLVRMGLEYEFEVAKHWDIAPTLFYDSRFGGYDTWSFALGVGKRF